MNVPGILALLAGAAIATQASLNSQLGLLLRSSMIATVVAFSCSALFTMLVFLFQNQEFPQSQLIKSVPLYMWFTGGILSAFGVGMFYYLIPKMGVGPMMSYSLTGQILIAVIASHFGWFDLPVKQLDMQKILGVLALIAGIIMINWE